MQRSASAVADVEKFFTQQTAGPVVAWDLFAETPLDFGSSKMTIEPQSKPVATVDGIDCDIVTIEQPAKGDEGASFRRLYIAKSDHLPRRFDRVREIPDPKDPAKKTTNTRSLVLSKLKTDGDAVPGAYILSVPDGYAVRTAAEKKRPAPKEKDPLRGPAVRDKDGFLAVGMAAPEWSLKDPEGVEHKLSDYKGKVVFMDFWATWCPPCRAAMPSVQRLHDKYKNKGVVVLGLDFNDNKDPAKYMKEHEFTYLLLLNAEKLADQYKISGIPAFFIVGKDGRIVYTGVGFPGDKAAQDAHDREIEKIIDDALAGKSEMMTPDNKK
jgi:thiol-disulfide isomerase/thioredoxin